MKTLGLKEHKLHKSAIAFILAVVMIFGAFSPSLSAMADDIDLIPPPPQEVEALETPELEADNSPEEPTNGFLGILGTNSEPAPISLTLIPPADSVSPQGEIVRKSGTELTVTVVLSISDMAHGVVAAFPVNDNVSLVGSGIPASYESGIIDDFEFTYGGTSYSGKYFVIVTPTDPGDSNVNVFSLVYEFANGITPDGETQPLIGYIMEADNTTAGNGIHNTHLIVKDDSIADESESYTFIAEATDNITIDKEIISVTDSDSGHNFSDFISRDYSEVAINSNDDFVVTYKLTVSTTGEDNTGRIAQEHVIIKDELSGFSPGAGAPQSISVQYNDEHGAVCPLTDENGAPLPMGSEYAINNDTATFYFPATLSAEGIFDDQTYFVTVTYSKSAYTNRLGETPILSALQTVSNVAEVTYKPVTEANPLTDTSNSVSHSFGYKQGEPTHPTLRILKKISISGESVTYSSAAQANYDNTVVKFALTPEIGAPIEVAVDGDGIAAFSKIAPGTYTLSESAGITGFGTAAPLTVKVTENISTGAFTMELLDSSSNPVPAYVQSQDFVITNTANARGNITVSVVRNPIYNDSITESVGLGVTVNLHDAANEAIIVATAVTNSDGKVTFYNLDTTTDYVLKGGTLLGGDAGKYSALPVAVDNISINGENAYTIKYSGNGGSFVLDKVFLDPAGNEITVSDYVVTFELYDATNTKVGDDIVITKNTLTDTSGIVQQLIPAGTYYLREKSLDINIVSTDPRYDDTLYPLYTGNNITVEIIAGKYDAVPTAVGVDANRIDAQGRFVNKHTYGELIIANYNIAGGKFGNLAYTVTDKLNASNTWSGTLTNGTAKILLPEGLYEVTLATAAGYTLLSSSTAVMIDKGTSAVDNTTVANNGDGSYTLNVGGSTQTAAFLSAILPNITARKVNAANSAALISGAIFTLYRLNPAGTAYELQLNGATPVTATSASGNITFTGLEAGEYLLVETTQPTGYFAPDYVANFYTGSLLKASVPVALATGAPQVVVSYSNYHATMVQSVSLASNIINAAHVVPSIATATTDSAAHIQADYELYEKDGATWILIATATSNGTAAGVNFTYVPGEGIGTVNLLNGEYKIKQILCDIDYVWTSAEVEFTVDTDGNTTITKNDLTGYPNATTNISNAAGGNSVTITYTNVPKPDVEIQKYGETDGYVTESERAKEPLADAEFIMYYEDSSNTKQYLTFTHKSSDDSENDDTIDFTYTPNEAQASILTSGALGYITINNLNPNVAMTYYLKEVAAPTVPGNNVGLAYTPDVTWTMTLALKGDNTGYTVTLAGSELSPENRFIIVNEIQPHYMILQKLFQKDNVLQPEDTPAANGIFLVYALGNVVPDGGGVYDFSAKSPVDVLYTGSGALANNNLSVSRALPAGDYILVEIQVPVGAAPNSVIYEKIGSTWTDSGTSAIVDGTPKTYPALKVTLSENNEYTFLPLANELGGGGGDIHYVRMYGIKNGYAVQTDNDGYMELGPISGVDFDIYLTYLDDNGDYQIIGDDTVPYQTVTSGNTYVEGVGQQPGEFLSGWIIMGHILREYKATTGIAPDENVTFALKLVERGPVPANYSVTAKQIANGDYPTYYYNIPFTLETYNDATNTYTGHFEENEVKNAYTLMWDSNDDIVAESDPKTSVHNPIELQNVAGEGSFKVYKSAITSNHATLTSVTFDLYRANTRNFADAVLFAGTIDSNNNDGANAAYSLDTGYYWLVETSVSAGFNRFGSYSSTYLAYGESSPVAGVSGNFDEDEPIGPFLVTAASEVRVSVADLELGSINIANRWNAANVSNASHNATYKIQSFVGGSFVDYAYDGTNTTFTVSGNTAKTISNLYDGTYQIFEAAYTSGTTPEQYHTNKAASTDGIVFVVNRGVVTSVKINGVEIGTGTSQANFNASNQVTGARTGTNPNYNYTQINVNHEYKGALVIIKGYTDYDGEVKAATNAAGPTSAAFEVYKKNGSGVYVLASTVGTGGIITWTYSAAGLRTILEPGDYYIKEISTTPAADYEIDGTPAYFKVGDTGTVYLQNATSSIATESAPLTTKVYVVPYPQLNNESKFGKLDLYKTDVSGGTSLSGAEFEVYTENNEIYTKVAATVTFTESPTGKYSAKIAPGVYYIKETQAPTGYSTPVAGEYFGPIYVSAATVPAYIGYENAANLNSLGIRNAQLTSFTVKKVSTYPQIVDLQGNELVAAATSDIGGMTLRLYKLKDGGNSSILADWIQVGTDVVTDVAGATRGSYVFRNLDAGVYRVIEVATSGLEYLALNAKYASLANSPDIVVTRKADGTALEVNSSAAGADWSVDTLTIDNSFTGVLIAVHKTDYDTGVGITGAKFELYDSSKTKLEDVTTTNGVAYFTPRYVTGNTTFYVKETDPGTGYIIDEFYDNAEKTVIITSGDRTKTVEFVNRQRSEPVITLTKSSNIPGNQVSTYLRDAELDVTYTITQNLTTANRFPLENYTVTDNGPKFYGDSGSEITANKPTYNITEVRIAPSTAIAKDGDPSESVWVSVNNGTWTRLNDSTATVFPLVNAQDVTVKYSSIDPTVKPETPWIGANFTPGAIEVDVTYDKYTEPTQAEVAEITNTAAVTGTHLGTALPPLSYSNTLTLPVPEFASLAITKTVISSDATYVPGESKLKYKIVLTNTSATQSLADPIIIDFMQADALTLASSAVTVLPSGLTLSNNSLNAAEDIAAWHFAGDLSPGESIELELTVKLADIILGDTLTNTAYATSGAALRISADNPTGANFVAEADQKVISSTSTDPATMAEYAALTSELGARGLYVKAEVKANIMRNSGYKIQHSIKNGTANWVSNSNFVDFYPDDTVYYRMRVQNNDSAVPLTNLSLYDFLLFSSDWSTGFSNAWLDNFVNNIDIQTVGATVPSSMYTITFSNATTKAAWSSATTSSSAAGMQSFNIVFDPAFQLNPNDTLTITFSIELPDLATYENDWLDSVREQSGARFILDCDYGIAGRRSLNSGIVNARPLMNTAEITGTAWDDADRDGELGASELPLSGAVVHLLQAYTDTNGDPVGAFAVIASTTTDSDGKYTFTNIETSHGIGAPVYKVELENPNPLLYRYTAAVPYDEDVTSNIYSNLPVVAAGHTAADSGIIEIFRGGVINAGLYKLRITYEPGIAGANAQNMPSPLVSNAAEGTIFGISNDVPRWTGRTFLGWEVTDAPASAMTLIATPLLGYTFPASTATDPQSFEMPDSDVILTAKWSSPLSPPPPPPPDPGTKYSVIYASNGGSGTLSDGNSPYDAGDTVTVLSPAGSISRVGYDFIGWNTQADGNGAAYQPGDTFVINNSVILHAQWKKLDDPDDDRPNPIPPQGEWELNLDDHYAYLIGYPDGNVRPNGNITREEAVTIFFRLLTDSTRTQLLSYSNSFRDVDETRWSNTAISTLASPKIVEGYPDGNFKPSNKITRAEFAAMAVRFDSRIINNHSTYPDTVGHWAEDAISRATYLGWVQGRPDGTFGPDDYITRAEVATFANRMLLRLPDDERALLSNMIKWPDNSNTSAWYYIAIQEATNSHTYHRPDHTHICEKWDALTATPDWLQYERRK